MKKIRWCIIGAGGIADRRTIPGLLKDEGSELVAIMDKSPEAAKKVGEKYGVPYYTDENEMLRAHKPDAVYIGTPVFCHKDQALAALSHGASVLIEKPICMTALEARELAGAFKKAGKQLTVGYMMKHHNLHERMRDMANSGEIGPVVSIRAQFSCWYPDIPGAWRQTKALGGGGAFMDLGVHCAELIEYILGERITSVKSMTATGSFKYEVEDSAIVVFRTESGILGTIESYFNISDEASESKLEIYGNSGYLIAHGTLGQTESGRLTHLYAPQGGYLAEQNRTSGVPTEYLGDGGDLYEKQISGFCALLRDGTLDYTSLDRAVHIQELAEEIYKNAEK